MRIIKARVSIYQGILRAATLNVSVHGLCLLFVTGGVRGECLVIVVFVDTVLSLVNGCSTFRSGRG